MNSINFRNTNRWNVFINMFSGNILPVNSDESELSLLSIIYAIFTWIIILIHVCTCTVGIFRVSLESALRNSTSNLIISTEILFNLSHMYSQRYLLKRLIDNYDYLLSSDNELLKNTVVSYIRPIEKLLKFYTMTEVCMAVLWVSRPLLTVYQKEQFVHEDYVLPISVTNEPISRNIFIISVILEIFGLGYLIMKKVSTDIYRLHLILLLTSQYKYLRIQMGMIFQRDNNFMKHQNVDKELNSLLRHHSIVVQATNTLKKLLSFSVCIIHLDSVLRFCFLSYMLVEVNHFSFMEGCVIISYAIVAILQIYMICFYIQELLEAGSNLTEDAFYEGWYSCELPVKQKFKVIMFTNKMKCQLSYCENVDLNLPSFVQIISQAYSMCLLLLKFK
ncbi:odorant receptor 94a-like [Polistes fuscatus]|uniref:odorant receptor 94a-like n=1 Tax=Polistes fuscatus TaxID=30207 RepID=UPI001CA9D5FB|nr:odorant receptor 94a-like [Polistes fuscatus]